MLAFWHRDHLNLESWMPVLTGGFSLGAHSYFGLLISEDLLS